MYIHSIAVFAGFSWQEKTTSMHTFSQGQNQFLPPSNSPCLAHWQVSPGHVILSDNQLLILHKYYQIADSETHEASQTFSQCFNGLGV